MNVPESVYTEVLIICRSTMGLVMPKVQKPHLTSEPDTDDEWRELSEEL